MDEIRLSPATAIVHLEFNGGEDVDIELVVRDKLGVPVPLTAAVGTIGMPGCPNPLHVWSVAAGNLELPDQSTSPGTVILSVTKAQTTAWFGAWGDAEWQLDTIDLFARSKRACEGDVRVNPTRQAAA